MKVITIGRDETNDVVIANDLHASRHHLQIIQHDNGQFTLKDFGSTNGTSVNGNRVRGEVPLNEMDIVRVGNTTIPWRDYFYFDEHENSNDNATLNFSDDTPSLVSSVVTEKIEHQVSKWWMLSIGIVAILLCVITIIKDCLLISELYVPEYVFWLIEGVTIICALALAVLSMMLLYRRYARLRTQS